MKKSNNCRLSAAKPWTISQPSLFCFELVSMQKLRQLKAIETTSMGEFNALGFVIVKRTYTIAGQTAVLPRIRALLKYRMIFARTSRSKHFYVDFVSSMASVYSISSGSLHAVSRIIVKMAFWNRKSSLTFLKKCNILKYNSRWPDRKRSIFNENGSLPSGRVTHMNPIFRSNTQTSAYFSGFEWNEFWNCLASKLYFRLLKQHMFAEFKAFTHPRVRNRVGLVN